MGYSDLGCYDGEIETPNLNQLPSMIASGNEHPPMLS